jgi:hypothetical protein
VIKKALNYKCHPYVFGLYRIVLGAILLIYFLLLSNRWIEFYGPNGISPIKMRDVLVFRRLSVFSFLHGDVSLWIYFAVILLMLFAFILGRLGKLPAIFVWLAMISVENSNAGNVNAEEFVLCVFAFYAMIMPINSTLVFDFKSRKFTDNVEPVFAWTLIPFLIHIDLIYIISLPLKPYFDHAWVDGTLVYLAANTFDMSRFPGLEVLKIDHAIVSKLMTWSSLLVEAAFPLLVWTKRFRVPVILAMVSFQLGIAVLLSGVQFFSISMIIALILFLPSEATHDFFTHPSLEQLRSWLGWPSSR